MKLADRHNNVVSGGSIGEDSGFSIAMNAKMFRTLSDTMYQDKIGSMIRELSCNAMDAHIAAGTPDKPFYIHLPDQIEPWFAVKDEGTGLSDTDIRAMYTTYGASTKDQSNDQVGAFGLGSKTPFAYTDQFTVTSVFDGVKRVYVAVMSDDGLPVLKMQHEEKTSDHPGLEVNVSVNDYDFQTFREKVVNQLRFFRVKPTILNNRHSVEFKNLNSEEMLVEHDGVKVFKNWRTSGITGIWVVQGGVGYQLSVEKLGDMDNSTKSFAKAIDNHGAVIEFDIGDIEVTASREGISYTVDTRKRIIKKIGDVANAIAAETIAELRKMTSIWERASAYNGMMEVLQRAVQSAKDFDKLFPENRVFLRSGNMIIKVKPINDMGLDAVAYVKYTGYKRGWNAGSFVRLQRKTVSDERSYANSTVSLHPEADLKVFIRDTNSKPVARLNYFAENNNYPSMLIIEGFKGDVEAKDIKKVAAALDIPENKITLLSSLYAPKSNNAGSGGGEARPRAFKMPTDGSIDIGNSREWEKVYDNLDDIGDAIWIKMERHDISWANNCRIVLEAAKRGLLDKPVIVVNNQTADRIENGKVGSQLTSGEIVAKELLEKIESFKPIYRALAKYRSYSRKIASGNRHVSNIISNGAIPGLNAVRKRIDQLEKRVKGWEWAQNNSDADLLDTASHDGEKAGMQRNQNIVNRYPLLGHIVQHAEVPAEHIENYIKMVDERG